MTATQRDALQRINIVIQQQVERIKREYPDGMDGKPVIPSRWVFLYTLTDVHHLRRSTIKALIKQGILEERPSGGWGPEVSIK